MSLIEQWNELAYDNENENQTKKLWNEYFAKEKNIYKIILSDVDKEIVGTVEMLANKFDMKLVYFVGFLDGINESLVKQIDLENVKESTKIKIKIVPEKMYFNMVKLKATWLYELPEWDNIFSKEKRREIYEICKSEQVAHRTEKIYPNDPCPCGSGKKYKKCCGKDL